MPVPDQHQSDEREPYFEIWEPVEPATPDDPPIAAVQSPVLEVVGLRFELAPGVELDLACVPPTKPLLDLARIDAIVSLDDPVPPRTRKALSHEPYRHKAVVGWLDRFGCLTTEQVARAARPGADVRWAQRVLGELYRAGLVERRRAQLSSGERGRGGSAPWLWSLTAAGLRQGKVWRIPDDTAWWSRHYWPQIPADRRWRRSEARTSAWLGHDLHAADWAMAMCRLASEWEMFSVLDVFTPRYLEGQLCPPRKLALIGARPHAPTLSELPLDLGWMCDGISRGPFTRTIKPDLTLRLWLRLPAGGGCEFDLLVELDRTRRPAKNLGKLVAYDDFLTGWALLQRRVQERGRPVVIFVCPDETRVRGLMEAADRLVVGRIGQLGMPADHWRYPGREHLLFTIEPLIHHDSLLAWRLPALPPDVRGTSNGNGVAAELVTILPAYVMPPEPTSPWGG